MSFDSNSDSKTSHCERGEAIQETTYIPDCSGLLRRYASRNDGLCQIAATAYF